MIALVLAAQIAALAPPIAERTPNLYKLPARCIDVPTKVVDRYGRPVARKLADLPSAALIYTVDRRLDGCPQLVVAYGLPELDNPAAPPPHIEPLAPARREDGRSDRR